MRLHIQGQLEIIQLSRSINNQWKILFRLHSFLERSVVHFSTSFSYRLGQDYFSGGNFANSNDRELFF